MPGQLIIYLKNQSLVFEEVRVYATFYIFKHRQRVSTKQALNKSSLFIGKLILKLPERAVLACMVGRVELKNKV
jgi:hypothetical protein